jgi:arsenate reductase
MTERAYNVLFLCTGNSARSILAESILRHWGKDRFAAYSAGSHPTGTVHPYAMDLLRSLNLPITDLRSKSWDEFTRQTAPRLDFIFTVCDNAAGEACPVWPGNPMTAHWGVPDPASVVGLETERRAAFRRTFRELENRIKIFVSLRTDKLDRLALQRELTAIGKTTTLAPQ